MNEHGLQKPPLRTGCKLARGRFIVSLETSDAVVVGHGSLKSPLRPYASITVRTAFLELEAAVPRSGVSGFDKTVQNLTDRADRNTAGQTLRKDLLARARSFVSAFP